MSSNFFIRHLGSPKVCFKWCRLLQPWVMFLCLILFSYGLVDGLLFAPADYQQGEVFRIIYIHVPTAIMSLLIYVMMFVSSVMYFVWKIKVADVVSKVSASLGALFTLLTLITGSLWGKPTWGTFWIWDARLTSELILLFMYFGIIAIRSAIHEPVLAARAAGMITFIGMINIPIVHYSVNWWNTLHQGATLLKFGQPSIAPEMLWPLLAMIAAFIFYYVWMLLIRIQYELLLREQNTAWVKAFLQDNFR